MATKKVIPAGMLYSQGRVYFLLKPYPIVGDSWEKDNAYRWLVVPRKSLGLKGTPQPNGNIGELYPHARHIVTTAFVVDYTELPEIEIKVLDEYDVIDEPTLIFSEHPSNDFHFTQMQMFEEWAKNQVQKEIENGN
jgi:hypothetical protein